MSTSTSRASPLHSTGRGALTTGQRLAAIVEEAAAVGRGAEAVGAPPISPRRRLGGRPRPRVRPWRRGPVRRVSTVPPGCQRHAERLVAGVGAARPRGRAHDLLQAPPLEARYGVPAAETVCRRLEPTLARAWAKVALPSDARRGREVLDQPRRAGWRYDREGDGPLVRPGVCRARSAPDPSASSCSSPVASDHEDEGRTAPSLASRRAIEALGEGGDRRLVADVERAGPRRARRRSPARSGHRPRRAATSAAPIPPCGEAPTTMAAPGGRGVSLIARKRGRR